MYRPLTRFLTVLACIALAAPALADFNAPTDSWPDWVKDAMAQEGKRLKSRRIDVEDEDFTTRLPGKAQPPKPIEDGWYFITDIGSDSPMECYLYETAMDLAFLTDVLAETNIEFIGEQFGEIGNRNVTHVGSGQVDGYPFLALEWMYTVGEPGKTRVANTKVRAAAKHDIALACTHNALGFRETFANAFAMFVESTEYKHDVTEPFYEEIATLDMNQIGAGAMWMSYTLDEDGDTRAYSNESVIIPVSASEIMSSDSVSITYTTPDHEIINAVMVDVEKGEVVNNLTLNRDDNGDWVSAGLLQGKEVSTIIGGTTEPYSELAMLALTREYLAGNEERTAFPMWIPSADPTQFLPVVLRRDAAAEKLTAVVEMGPMEINGRFEEDGNMVHGTMSAGPINMSIDRVWHRGAVWQ